MVDLRQAGTPVLSDGESSSQGHWAIDGSGVACGYIQGVNYLRDMNFMKSRIDTRVGPRVSTRAEPWKGRSHADDDEDTRHTIHGSFPEQRCLSVVSCM